MKLNKKPEHWDFKWETELQNDLCILGRTRFIEPNKGSRDNQIYYDKRNLEVLIDNVKWLKQEIIPVMEELIEKLGKEVETAEVK